MVLQACLTTTAFSLSAMSTSCCMATSSLLISSQLARSSAMRPSAPASSGCCSAVRLKVRRKRGASLWERDM
eukprot:CAMPEP_0202912914 /NCGR_PEP_ID=MMETSP1392-20130828/59018_1 /ASSEMBLY_ACC=CAM_ASM_000868 /TAXON_ID=225041 /ORGANISM="Chlamydomonas chlamydogama, Strain SAG 11-48b" /LENGTH=71 /DNA_ID=CAMNT_0049603995 /DNA_START=106 /DNA_END=321 /DNA_ORIENTATION=+